MAINDMFGRSYERIEDFTPAAIDEHRSLYADNTDRYIGLLTKWRGIGWTHSLHRFGEPPLADMGDALHHFLLRQAERGEHCAVRVGSRNLSNVASGASAA